MQITWSGGWLAHGDLSLNTSSPPLRDGTHCSVSSCTNLPLPSSRFWEMGLVSFVTFLAYSGVFDIWKSELRVLVSTGWSFTLSKKISESLQRDTHMIGKHYVRHITSYDVPHRLGQFGWVRLGLVWLGRWRRSRWGQALWAFDTPMIVENTHWFLQIGSGSQVSKSTFPGFGRFCW